MPILCGEFSGHSTKAEARWNGQFIAGSTPILPLQVNSCTSWHLTTMGRGVKRNLDDCGLFCE
jgi:hypothetical protein